MDFEYWNICLTENGLFTCPCVVTSRDIDHCVIYKYAIVIKFEPNFVTVYINLLSCKTISLSEVCLLSSDKTKFVTSTNILYEFC